MKQVMADVIIVAGGKGLRMNSDVSKQYLKLEDEYIIALSIKKFEDCPNIRDIIVVVANEHYNFFKSEIGYKFKKIKEVVIGGDSRQESVYAGLKTLPCDSNIVLIHDAVRPFIKNSHIVKIINEVGIHKSCIMGVKVKDTIKTAKDSLVTETPDRNNLYIIQTPQAFEYNIILEAHKKAANENYIGTDDSVLVERLGISTKIVEGSYSNIKITTPEDLLYGKSLLREIG